LIKNNPKRLKIKDVGYSFLKAFLVLMKLFDIVFIILSN